ncbi:uncharacterized protein CDAR_392141 [Caerostris darwini]|uniref:Uncharacterized protein n=1 Tax=Caerostris darwini TaxID=1538125 RepID=A0AAV4UGJ7_9ARAC|nr:uncharacterized protein CDAR_392141 [Caerostris darwini]
MAKCTKKNACGINVSRLGKVGNAKRGMIAIIPLFECDGSIGPQGDTRDSRRSIGCGCGYSTSFFPSIPLRKRCRPLSEYGMSRLICSDSPISRLSAYYLSCSRKKEKKKERKNIPIPIPITSYFFLSSHFAEPISRAVIFLRQD